MPGPSILLSALGALAASSLFSRTHAQYSLVDSFSGNNFFNNFEFYTDGDPTNGFVQYVNSSYASASGLTSNTDTSVHIGVDTTNTYTDINGPGRPSVRLSSNRAYNHGLFILDLNHAPWGCGVWPAFWTLGPNWPYTGEIDIMEGVNQNTQNLVSLHTNATCTIAGSGETGTLITNDCESPGTDNNAGCGVRAAETTSYGQGFNDAGGGYFVMEWTSDWIRVWTFTPDNVPASITSGAPDPSSDFGTPDANMQGDCDIDQHMQDHNIIFDITFCGDYAGNTYSTTTCPNASDGMDGCKTYIGNNPGDLTEAYWDINSLQVYQQPSSSPNKFDHTPSLTSVVPLASKSPAVAKQFEAPALGNSTVVPKTTSSLPPPTQTGS